MTIERLCSTPVQDFIAQHHDIQQHALLLKKPFFEDFLVVNQKKGLVVTVYVLIENNVQGPIPYKYSTLYHNPFKLQAHGASNESTVVLVDGTRTRSDTLLKVHLTCTCTSNH